MGLSIDELSAVSKVDRDKIVQVEKGEEVIMTGRDMNKIAKAVGAKVSDIFFDK